MSAYTTTVVDSEGRLARLSAFPDSWGPPPTTSDSAARRRWIAANARCDGIRSGHPAACRAFLEEHRQAPEAEREQGRIDMANRLRRQYLDDLLRDCP